MYCCCLWGISDGLEVVSGTENCFLEIVLIGSLWVSIDSWFR